MRTPDSFEAVFPLLLRDAARAAHAVTGDRVLAEDVAAETLHRVFVRWNLLDPETRAAWTKRVARNLAIDQLRRRTPNLVALPADGADQFVAERVDVAVALAELPSRQREVVALRYFADLSEVEAATAMRVSVNTVRTHLRRALATLRPLLGPEADVVLTTVGRNSPMSIATLQAPGRLVDRRTIRYDRSYRAGVGAVWDALVGDLDGGHPACDEATSRTSALGAWFIPIPTHLEACVGGRFWFGDESEEVLAGVVIGLVPQRELVLLFRNGSGAMFELAANRDHANLVYTHWMPTGFTLPQDRPDNGVDLSNTDNFAWNHQPLGPGSYQPALAACWHGSLLGLAAYLGDPSARDHFDATSLYEQYRDAFVASAPVW
jgi:RNA polymerase sigma factor (sigma-70 family)